MHSRVRDLSLSLSLSLLPLTVSAQTSQSSSLPPPPPAITAPTPSVNNTSNTPRALTVPTQDSPADLHWSALTTTPPASQRRHAFTRERLRLLDTSLIPLGDRSRSARRTQAIVNIVIGAGLIGLGFAFSALTDSDTVSPTQALLWVQGGYTMASGTVGLLWTPTRETLSDEYSHRPRRTPHERRSLVHFGEQALDDIAADGRRRRILSSLAGAGFSLATLGILYRDQIFDGAPWPEPPAFNYLVIGLVGLSMVTTLIPLFTTSSDERMRDNYRRQLQLLRETEGN